MPITNVAHGAASPVFGGSTYASIENQQAGTTQCCGCYAIYNTGIATHCTIPACHELRGAFHNFSSCCQVKP
ncbi:hypothetical protein Vi05172_g5605 [Venturia inaequalis]|nr:hypothetical protein Vi05172_g5605 [Venturia inaequalis]